MTVHTYPGDRHLLDDDDLPDQHDPGAAALIWSRVEAFLADLGGAAHRAGWRHDDERRALMVAGIPSVEVRYREMEAAEEENRRRKMRRQPWLLLGLVNVLILGTAATAAVDLRRLRTPGGVALAWTQAAVFGDCEDYRQYSVSDGGVSDRRTPDELCLDLRAATEQARAESLSIGLTRGVVSRVGARATVPLTVTRRTVPLDVTLSLVLSGGRWHVVRDTEACRIGCA